MMNIHIYPQFLFIKKEETNNNILKHIKKQLSVYRLEMISKKKSALMHAFLVEVDEL